MTQTRTEIQNRYDAKNCKHFSMKYNLTTDADVIAKLASVPSVQGYIKQLIRQDLENSAHKTEMSLDDWISFMRQNKGDYEEVYDLLNAIVNRYLGNEE